MNVYNIAVFLSSLLVNDCYAQLNKILIVNSNNTVQRYEKISLEFKKSLPENTYQWSEFNLEGHSAPEDELQQIIQKENPNFIYCIGSKAYSLSQDYAKDSTLLFSAAINWHRLNINNKTYGISNELSPEQEMMFLKFFFPDVKRIGLIYSKEFNQEYIETVKKDAENLAIEILVQQINHTSEISSALHDLLPKIDMFWLIADPLVLENQESVLQIFQLAKQQQKPVYAYSDVFIKYGAVLSVSPDIGTIGRQSATLMMSLQAPNLPHSPVQLPAGSSITLNMCSAETLRVKLNKEALASVNKIVPCGQNEPQK